MKLFLILCLAFSFSAYADDHEGYYEPNVAEYYVSTFKEGKDMDDMMRWAEKWTKWAEESDAFKDYRSAMLVPYYHSGELPHDFVWVGISPDPEAHYGGNDYWVNNGCLLYTSPSPRD